MKRNILNFLFTTIVISVLLCFSGFAEDGRRVITDEQIDIIKLLEIANGDTSGNMNFDKNVTRAEFVKMAVSASNSKDLATNMKLNVALFPDVRNNHWCAGYISVAIDNKLVTGYIDGTFKPTNNVTLEEAATIVLRLLGYSDEDYVGSYPYAQLQKYKDLDLDKNIYAERGEKLTREECMILLYNALSAKTKAGSVYCTTLGYSTNSSGNLDYISMIEATISKPIYIETIEEAASYSSRIPFDITNSKIYYNGKSISSADIKQYDVLYYSKEFNTIWIYRKTLSGTIEEITPETSPTSVTVSGKSHKISSSNAQFDLSIYGGYEVGDRVTLILGMNDDCIAVEDAAKTSGIVYGVITELGKKSYTDKDGEVYDADYVKITDTSCNTYTYEHKNSKFSVGDVVKAAVGEKVTISKLSTDIGKNAVNLIVEALEKGSFSSNCEIIDIKNADVIKIKPSRLSGVKLDRDYFNYNTVVLFYELDENGSISKLILNDFTGDINKYGIVTDSANGTVKYITDKKEQTIQTNTKCSVGAAKLIVEDGSIVSANALNGYIENVSLTNNAVYDNKDVEYFIADDLKVFIKSYASYEQCEIEDVQGGDYKLTAYYDKLPQYGGRIRVVIATKST